MSKLFLFHKEKDPDSYSKKLNTAELQSFLDENAVNFVDYLIEIYKLNEEKDPAKIIDIKKKIILSIAEIPDVFSREEYCKIYHYKLGVSEEALLKQISKARSRVKQKPNIRDQKIKPVSSQKNITNKVEKS